MADPRPLTPISGIDHGCHYRAAIQVLQGLNVADIAARENVPTREVIDWLTEATGMTLGQWRDLNGWVGGVSPATGELVAEYWADFASQYPTGMSTEMLPKATLTVASDLGLTQTQVEAVLAHRNLWPAAFAKRGGAKALDLDMPDIIHSYLTGETTVSIAQRHGVNDTTICRRLERAGVPRRPRGTPQGTEGISSSSGKVGTKTTRSPKAPGKARSPKATTKSRSTASPKRSSRNPSVHVDDDTARGLVLSAWKQHPSLHYVAEQTPVGHRRARAILTAAGVHIPTRSTPRRRKGEAEARRDVLRIWGEFGNVSAIEREAGIGKVRARRILTAAGLLEPSEA